MDVPRTCIHALLATSGLRIWLVRYSRKYSNTVSPLLYGHAGDCILATVTRSVIEQKGFENEFQNNWKATL